MGRAMQAFFAACFATATFNGRRANTPCTHAFRSVLWGPILTYRTTTEAPKDRQPARNLSPCAVTHLDAEPFEPLRAWSDDPALPALPHDQFRQFKRPVNSAAGPVPEKRQTGAILLYRARYGLREAGVQLHRQTARPRAEGPALAGRRPWIRAYSRPACAENLLGTVSG